MLQEQVSEYLVVTSFKRKYPGMNCLHSLNKILFKLHYGIIESQIGSTVPLVMFCLLSVIRS